MLLSLHRVFFFRPSSNTQTIMELLPFKFMWSTVLYSSRQKRWLPGAPAQFLASGTTAYTNVTSMIWESEPLAVSMEKLKAFGIASLVFVFCGNTLEPGGCLRHMQPNIVNLRQAF